MTRSRWWPLVALLLLAAVLVAFAHQQRAIGARDAALKTLSTGYAQLATRKQVTDTQYVRDTLRLTRWRTLLKDRADTLIVTDTIKVRDFIAVADATLNACTDALTTCERRVAVRDSIIANRDSTIDLLTDKHVTIKPRCVLGPNLSTDGKVRLGVSCGLGF